MTSEFYKDIIRIIFWFPIRWLSRILPRQLLMKLGSILGTIFYFSAHHRRKILTKELHQCLPAYSDRRMVSIARQSFICFTKDQLDVLLYPYLNKTIMDNISVINGSDHLEKVRRSGNGCILLLCHLGSNQFLMPALGHRGFTIGQVSLPADAVNIVFGDEKISFIHQKMLTLKRKMEESLPTTHIFLEQGLWEALNWLKTGNILAIAVDGRHGKRFWKMSFCGRIAQYSPSPFILSLRSKAPLIPTFIIRDKNDRHQVIVEPPLSIPESENLSKEEVMKNLLRNYLKRLEHYFSLYPEQYGMFFYLAHKHTANKHNSLFII